MPILSQGYETYSGPLRSSYGNAFTIAGVALRRHLRWFNWVLLAAALLFGSGFEFIVIFMSYAAAAMGGGSIGNEANMLRALSEGHRFYADMMITQTYWALAMATIVGAGEIAEDLRTGSLVFYLSRPLHRWQYILGKVLAVSIAVAAVMLLPTLALFTWHASLVGDVSWLLERWRIPVAALAQFAVTSLFLSGLILGISALARRRRWATVAVVAVYLGLTVTSVVLAKPRAVFAGQERDRVEREMRNAQTEEARRALEERLRSSTATLDSASNLRDWRFLSPGSSLEAAGRDLYGLPLPDNFGGGRHWGYLLLLAGAGFVVLARRVRAVEIVS